jgi:hypothetical protein
VIALSDSFWGTVATAPASFIFGAIVGFVLSNRYRITRRNGGNT